MPRSIYRSGEGRATIRAWCEMRLDAAGVNGYDIESMLGTTRVTEIGDGSDVVLLPGTNFSTATWLGLLAQVGGRHRAVGLDLPGQPGLSSGHRPRDRDAYGIWLREVITTLGLDRPVVVGHSLGGRVALAAAADDASIGGLVLVNPAGLIRLRVGPGMLATTVRWLVRRNEASSAALLRRMAAPGGSVHPDLAQWMTLVARHVRSSLAPPPLDRALLTDVRCPVHLVTGRHDPFLPAERLADALTEVTDQASASTVEAAGHLVPDEAPDEVVRAVEALTGRGHRPPAEPGR